MPVNVDPVGPTAFVYTTAESDAAMALHTHSSSQVTDFAEVAQDAVAALLAGASGVTLSYNDTANTLTITGGGAGGVDAEAVRDAIGVAMVGVGVITILVNDAADTITISSAATVNSTDAALRDRATHTGAQAISTVTGLQPAIDSTFRVLVWNGTAFPDRPNDTRVTFFIGGTVAPTDADVKNGDLWVS